MKKIVTITYVILILLLYGCYFDNEEELYPNTNCDITAVTYTNTISPLMTSSCATTGCHVAGTGRVLLTNYAEVKTAIGGVENRAVTKKDMPPAGALASCDITKLKAWIDAGALNN